MGKKQQGKFLRPATGPTATAKPPPPPAPVPTEKPVAFFTWEDWAAAALTFLISGLAFLYYMSPSVTLQDSGELVTGAYHFGVPHPPGYPLWALLGWGFRHLVPFGNPAWQICLLSVCTGAALVGILTLLMTRSILMLLRSSPWAGAIEEPLKHWIALTTGTCVSLVFAFNRGVWLWACVPEMRVLNVFLFILTACTFFAWMMRPERHAYLYATILVYGLGISNHQTIALMVLPFMVGAFALEWFQSRAAGGLRANSFQACLELLVAVLLSAATWSFVMVWTGMKQLREFMPVPVLGEMDLNGVAWLFALSGGCLLLVGAKAGWLNARRALVGTVMFLIGAGFYAYMPLAASTNPPMNWGYTATKAGFLHHITRGQYEKLHVAAPLSKDFFLQIQLSTSALINQFSLGIGLFGLVPVIVLARWWSAFQARARCWLIFVLTAFVAASFGLLMIINPGLDKQQQDLIIKFFAPAHGFYAMLIGYGLALVIGAAVAHWPGLPRPAVRVGCLLLLALPLVPFNRNWSICEQRGHDFGYQFGYRMFYPGGGYPPMDRDAVLFGGTDPGRFVPTYMIFCESQAAPANRFRDPHLDPAGGARFDRRDVYIITQNALADNTYMSYIRDHYDYARPRNDRFLQRLLGRDQTYPREPIYIPGELDLQEAFRQYVEGLKTRQPGPEEQVRIIDGQVQVQGVGGVMAINGILTRWIFDRNKEKHAFYVEESYVIPWMYPYLQPCGILMKITKDPLPAYTEDQKRWDEIVAHDRAYWDQLIADFLARPEFPRDTDAQKTFSKLRAAIGGIYAYRKMYPQAIYAFSQSQVLCPDSPEANFRLAQLYVEVGRLDDAVATLQAYEKRDPLNRRITEAIQQLIGFRDQAQQAQAMERALIASPRDVQLVLQLAQVRARAGQLDRVLQLCDTYLAQTNLPAGDMLQVARVFLSMNQPQRCIAALNLVIQRFPQSGDAYYAQAVVYAAQSLPDNALTSLEKAVAANPGLREAARGDTRLNTLRSNPRFDRLLAAAPPPAPAPAPFP